MTARGATGGDLLATCDLWCLAYECARNLNIGRTGEHDTRLLREREKSNLWMPLRSFPASCHCENSFEPYAIKSRSSFVWVGSMISWLWLKPRAANKNETFHRQLPQWARLNQIEKPTFQQACNFFANSLVRRRHSTINTPMKPWNKTVKTTKINKKNSDGTVICYLA